MPGSKESFNETVPLEPESGPVAVPPSVGDTSAAPLLPGIGVGAYLGRHGCAVAPGVGRYQVRELLGIGATARVWSALDRDLDRAVAVKVLEGSNRTSDPRTADRARGFIDEARITAALQHPNVIPVHELGVTAEGTPYFSMGKVSGRSLGDLLRASTPTARDVRIAEPNAVVNIFIGILHALEYAHAQRVVHQDVKPDNILLGDFGEVLLLDWGSAARIAEDGSTHGALFGTPLYMSPEQTRRERVDRLSDVYCVGAALFHALTLREPTWSPDPEEFWRKKRAGEIDPATAEERAAVPPALLAIALKGLSPDAVRRYHSAATMRADLERFQAGQAVSARRESTLEALQRWYGRNRGVAWTAAVSAAAILAIALGLWIEKRKETARWTLAYAGDFADGGVDLSKDWTCWVQEGGEPRPHEVATFARYWQARGGALIGAYGAGFADLTFRRAMLGDLRVEWDIANLTKRNDYNCFIDGPTRASAFTFHVGGWGHPRYCRLSSGEADNVCDENLEVPEMPMGTTHHFVMERVGQELRLEIDGRTIIAYHRADGGVVGVGDTFGFDACYDSVLRIDHVRVWHRPSAELLSPLAIGDKLLEHGDIGGARRQYEEIANSYDGELGRTAAFKAAITALRGGDQAKGLAALDAAERAYPDDPSVAIALCERLRAAHSRDDESAAADLLRRLAAYRGNPVLRTVFYEELRRSLSALDAECQWGIDKPRSTADIVLDVDAAIGAAHRLAEQYGLKAPMVSFTTHVADLLRATDHSDYMVAAFVDDERSHLVALADTGRFDELLARYSGRGFEMFIADALLAMGRAEEVASGPYSPDLVNLALAELGRPPRAPEPTAAAALIPHDSSIVSTLLDQKRYDELVTRYPGSWQADQALLNLRRYEEALHTTHDFGMGYRVLAMLLADGREGEARALLGRLEASAIPDQLDDTVLFTQYFVPVLLAADESRDRAEQLLTAILARRRWTFAQRVWHIAAFAGGHIDTAAFRRQPHHRWMELYLHLAEALRAALAHDARAELAAWKAVEALPDVRHHGYLDSLVMSWRLSRLGAGPPTP